jgi:hypothetical protein
MRTKTLLLTAALTAAGALTSMAQVYSVNVVGYVNKQIPSQFSLIANQLDATPDNTIKTLFPAPPNLTVIYKYDPATGFSSETFGNGNWSSGGLTTMNPGEGVFIFAPSAFTATFVGQVRSGSTDLPVPTGFSIVSAMYPQAGHIYDPTTTGQDLNYGAPTSQEIVYQYDNSLGYSSAIWLGNWGANPQGPSLAVGEAFFNFSPPAGGVHHWVRSFDPGTGFH